MNIKFKPLFNPLTLDWSMFAPLFSLIIFCMNNPLKQCAQPPFFYALTIIQYTHGMIIVIYYYHKIEQARNEANDVNMKI